MDWAKEQDINQKRVTGDPIVSFCIAAFQRYEILEELIQEILSVKTDKIEVAVCDDKSLDGSIEKIKKINDNRLKIYVNDENVGSSLNIHDSLDRGTGKYLFYINDRDNVDSFKIEKLIQILEEFEKEGVAFARCYATGKNVEKYHIFSAGKEAMLEFACRMDHPTGFIFKKDVWKNIKRRRILFENQNYGDYPITQICAIIAKKYKGALIYGDICDFRRHRINFAKEKSRFHEKRKDKRLWYTPGAIYRELKIGQTFLKKIRIRDDIREEILLDRYAQYLNLCVTQYRNMVKSPVYTSHYNFYPRQDFFHVFRISILNGLKLWSKILYLCFSENRQLIFKINKISRKEYLNYFKCILEDKFHLKEKYEIAKREAVLTTYEQWMNEFINKKNIVDFLLENGYHHVAIYGMGRIGKHLWKEFRNSDISVDFIIDQQISRQTKWYEDVPCFNAESEFPYVDIIIVSVPSEADKIIGKLRGKIGGRVKSIDDILFVLG